MILFYILISWFWPQQEYTAAPYLFISPSPEATGMGYVNTAIADDPSANYYNAAGLAFLTSPEVMLSYRGALAMANNKPIVYLGAVFPFRGSRFGYSLTYFNFGKDTLPEGPYPTFDKVSVWRLIMKLNFAMKLLDNLAYGIGLKYIHQEHFSLPYWPEWPGRYPIESEFVSGVKGNGWGIDLNLLYKVFPQLTTGIVMHNIGPDFGYAETGSSWPLPLFLRIGLLFTPINNENLRLQFATDITKMLVGIFGEDVNVYREGVGITNEDRDFGYEIKEAWKGIGSSVTFYKTFTIRCGYFYDWYNQRKGFTFGAGVNIKKFQLDYAIEDKNLLSCSDRPSRISNHSISLEYRF